MSPLLALSGHSGISNPCPLLGIKRTSPAKVVMSANDPKRTLADQQLIELGIWLRGFNGLYAPPTWSGFDEENLTIGRTDWAVAKSKQATVCTGSQPSDAPESPEQRRAGN